MEGNLTQHNMKLFKGILGVTLLCIGLATAEAKSITGLLNISGTATFNTNSLATAMSVVSFSGVTAGAGNTGSFSVITQGTPVMMASPYIFTPSTATPALWSVGGFTFDLTSSTVTTQNNHFLTISGTGTIFGPGFSATPGVWAFTTQNASGKPGSTFTFSANTTAVPDGGLTVTLLGAGLLGLAVFRKTLAKS